ncbi:ABC-2 transporter permease [Actinomyces oris]|uniref:ABC-2 transporter permease n=1 Tax=Actinomyces oris TaxID=544580 RepID=UPI00285298FD|nr:ABC-2 transporter permease [Actinomyces oris]
MNDLMTTDRRERPAEAVAVAETPDNAAMRGVVGGPGRVGRLLSLVRLHLLGLRGPLPFLLGLLLIVGAAGIVSGSIALVSGFLAGTALVGGLSGVMAERSGINRLLASLPVSRADVVNSYWAVAVLHLLAASALYAAIGLPLGVRPGKLLVLPLILITGQALGIPVFLHFGPGRGLLVWAVSILVVSILAIGALGLLLSNSGPIRDLAVGTTTGGGLLLVLGAGALIGLWVLSHRLYLKQDQ